MMILTLMYLIAKFDNHGKNRETSNRAAFMFTITNDNVHNYFIVMATICLAVTPRLGSSTGTTWPSRSMVRPGLKSGDELMANPEGLTPGKPGPQDSHARPKEWRRTNGQPRWLYPT